jgi:hypothetical protein
VAKGAVEGESESGRWGGGAYPSAGERATELARARLSRHQCYEVVVSHQAAVTYTTSSARSVSVPVDFVAIRYLYFALNCHLYGLQIYCLFELSALHPPTSREDGDAGYASQCSRRRPECRYRMVGPCVHAELQPYADGRDPGMTSSASTASYPRSHPRPHP